MNKVELRQFYLKRRQHIPPDVRAQKDAAICQFLLEDLDWGEITKVHIYRSQAAWGEVDTSCIVSQIHQLHPSIHIDLADIDPQQPTNQVVDYDLIIVPVVAYDRHKYRLGMGKGWYDRFLIQQPSAIKVGIAYSESRADPLPIEPHDVPLDKIISA